MAARAVINSIHGRDVSVIIVYIFVQIVSCVAARVKN